MHNITSRITLSVTQTPARFGRFISLKNSASLILLVSLFAFSSQSVLGQEVKNFNNSGNGSWTVPAGVTSVTVEIWGAGGAGGGSKKDNLSGGGGGGGAYISQTYNNITPGQTFNFTVSNGGAISNSSGNGNNGGNTSLTPPTGPTLTAGGGKGGEGGNGNSNGQAGTGGSATGNNSENGQQGQGGSNQTGGKGGDAARASNTGGTGGSDNNGQSGNSPGGGGGGGNAIGNDNGSANFKTGGAGANGRVKFTYTVNLTPTITSISPLSVCVGGQVIITGTNLNNTSQVRIGNANASSFSINSNTQITATVSSGSVGNGNVEITTPEGTARSNNSIDVIKLNEAPTTIHVNSTEYIGSNICINHLGQNSNINLKVSGGTLADGSIPRWYEGNCNGTYKGEGNDLNVNIPEGESKTFYVNYQGTCNTTDCITVTVTREGSLDGTTIGVITGQQEVCKNSSTITYTVPAITNAENYTWTLPSGASPTTGNLVTTTNSITVDYVNANSGNVTVVANGVGDCGGNSLQSSLSISVKDVPSAPTFVSPVSGICYGASQTYTVIEIPGATSYNWTLPTGATIASGDGTNTITVDFNNATSGAITVDAKNECATGDTTLLPITFKTVPGTPENITGPTILCPGETMVDYTISSLPNTISYNWTISNDSATFNGTSNTNSIALDISNTPLASFTISVVGVNDCGESVTASELLVSVNEKSTAPTTITSSNSNTICEGTSTTLNVSGGTLGTGAIIEWFTDSCEGTSAGTENNIVVSPTITTTYFARYNDDCGETACISIAINVDPLPLAAGTITGTNVVCQGETNVEYTVPSIDNATNYLWTLPTGASIVSGAGKNTIEVDYDMATAISGNISVQGQNDCGTRTISTNYAVTVNPEPVISVNQASQTICSDGSISPINILNTNSVDSISYSWTRDNTTNLTGITTSGNGSPISGSLTNTTGTPQTTTFTITATANGCTSETTATVTVNPEPVISVDQPSQIICSDGSISPINILNDNSVTGISYSWTRNNISNLTGIPTSGNGSPISGSLTNTTGTPQTTTFTITATANGCTSETTATVTVNPEPVISVDQPSQTICSDGSIEPINILNTNNVTGVSYSWIRDNTSNLTGLATSGNGSPISGALTNTTGTAQTTTFTITATANGCTSETTATVTVNPEPVISVDQPSQTICSDGTITPINILNTNSVGGISYSWTRNNISNLTGIPTSGNGSPISGSLTNTTGTPQTTTFTITATANGCTSETTATVTVNPEPVISVDQPSQTICSDGSIEPINILNTNNVTGVSYSWIRDNTSNLTGLATSGNGSPISGALTNTTGTAQTTTFTITATANGCTSETTATVTVNPEPVISVDQPSQIICSDGTITPINILNTNSVGGTTYSWTRDNTTNLTGIPTSGNGSPISGSLANTTGTPQTTTFTITATANGCTSETTAAVTVNPEPVISVNQSSQTICSDGSISPINILNDNSVTGISYSWTRNNSTNLTGIAASGNGSPISGSLTNTTGTPETTTFTITATANGCTSETTATITVNPKPELILDPNATFNNVICSGETTAITIIDDNNVDKTLTYIWSRTNTSGITGTSTGDSNTINVSLTNTTNTPQTTRFTVRANSEYNCISESITVDVIVNPAPTVSANNTLQTICFGDGIAPIVISNPNNISGVTYSWTRNNTTGLTGLESGTGSPISGTLVNTTSSPQTTTFTITANANGCASETTTATITVNPELIIGINPDLRPEFNETVCSDSEITPIEILNINALEDVEYFWERTDSETSISGMESGTGSSISGILESTYHQNRIVTFKVWAIANGCESNVIENIQIRVTPTPIVEISPIEQTICDGGTFSLELSNTYNTNGNTTYTWSRDNTINVTGFASSGSGTPSNRNNPLIVSGNFTNNTTETQTVTFTVTATRQGCVSEVVTATVEVYSPLTVPVIGDTQDVCWLQDPADLHITTPSSGGSGNYTYQWQRSTNNNSWSNISGATNSTFSPPQDEYYYRLRTTDALCSSVTSNSIVINYFGLGGIFGGMDITFNPKQDGYCPTVEITPQFYIDHSSASTIKFLFSYNSSYVSTNNDEINGTLTSSNWIRRESIGENTFTLSNDGNETISTQINVTPEYHVKTGWPFYSDYYCNGVPEIIEVEIHPTPRILNDTEPEITICSGTSPEILVEGNIIGTEADMEFSWTRALSGDNSASNGISTAADVDENNVFTLNNDILNNKTSSPITVTYTITPLSPYGCAAGVPVTYDVIVLPFIEAKANLLTTIDSCDDTTVQLTANIGGVWTALPLGGVFSSTTDSNATFTGESGTNYILTWTVTNGVLCGDSSTEVAVNIPACSGNDFDFNGTNTSVNFGNAYNLVGPFSIEIWTKPNSTTGNQTILSKRSPSNATNGYDLTLTNGNTVAFNWNNGKSISTSGLSSNRWYHVAVTFNGSSYKLYVDGILKATKNNEIGPQINSNLALLGAVQSSILPTNYFNGWLDELRIWNKALSIDQIREMMNQEIQNNGGKVRGSIIPIDIIGELDWNSNLVGYYQMGSNIINGTLASANGATSGVLRNMTTMQQETAPLPYESNGNSDWDTAAAWMNADVNPIPNTNGIEWNIVKIKNNVTLDRSTSVLGLIVENNTLTVPDKTPITVSKYLKLDGTLKLEGEAQLLQPENSVVDYSGSGALHRNQEGTTNIYNYNYWASPVSTSGTTNNRTYTLKEVLHVGTTPVGWTPNHDGAAGNPPYISTRWLYLYENYNSATFQWNRINENTEIRVGLGFIMKGASSSGFTFIGQPNNGDYLVNVDAGNDALIGNPYPSAIDAFAFITDNQSMLNDNGNNGEIRFWRQSTTNSSHVTKEYLGGYASLNLTGGNAAVAPDDITGAGDAASHTPKRYIPVAQGFFITAAQTGNIMFNNGQRIFKTEADDESIFSRSDGTTEESTNDIQRLRLSFKNPDNAIRQLLLGFTPDNAATDDVDFGYDATNFEELSSDLLFLINNKTYIIQGVGVFDDTKQYPLAMLIGKDGNVEISLKELENFDTPIDVFIYDSYADTYTQINNSKYQMHLEKGEYLDRYFLAFKDQNRLDIDDLKNELSEIKINYLDKTDELHIKTPNHINIRQVYLINTLGQTVKAWNTTNAPLSNNCKIPVQRISEGNYIVKVDTDKGSTSKKVIIKY
ncbi:PKD-like domain-containing protein [Formosa sp. PL04]|uniref:PKD-like domain-containing protein n=1 Tax=Formosa sp. PL04 TaxID=3081755 RepID=UPI0029826162|nr:PKD-like domain-containing protein [Formosa sp. PL04]MDW5289722.1 PKD-like domain-containing protein [Formosa sp. PL04]